MLASWYRLQQRIAITSDEALTLAIVASLLVLGAGLRAWDGAPVRAATPVETVSAYVTDDLAADEHAGHAPAGHEEDREHEAATPAVSAEGAEMLPDPLPSATSPALAFRVDPNTATAAQLERLPRIGPALAARIIAQRERRSFGKATDLLAVSGIGPKTLETLRPHLTLE